MDKRTKGIVTVGVLMIIVMVAVIIGVVVKRAGNISSGGGGISGTKQDMTLDEMYNELAGNSCKGHSYPGYAGSL